MNATLMPTIRILQDFSHAARLSKYIMKRWQETQSEGCVSAWGRWRDSESESCVSALERWREIGSEGCVSAWERWRESESEGCVSAWRGRETESKCRVSELRGCPPNSREGCWC